MDRYIGTKLIKAKPMTLGEYNKYRCLSIPNDGSYPADEAQPGYLVEYEDGGTPNHFEHKGYISWSPKDVFDRAYRRADSMTFGLAVDALKRGQRVARAGWNGRGMYLWLLPSAVVKADWCREPHLKAMAEANGGEIECLGSIRMMTADKKVLTGWLASQTDILAEDWFLVV